MASRRACAGDRTVGFVTIRQHTECAAEVHVMAVHPDWRRRGAGSLLLAHVEPGLVEVL